jgi:hypothetical protein
VPIHRLGRSRGSDPREGDDGNQQWQCNVHGEPPTWGEPLTPGAERRRLDLKPFTWTKTAEHIINKLIPMNASVH